MVVETQPVDRGFSDFGSRPLFRVRAGSGSKGRAPSPLDPLSRSKIPSSFSLSFFLAFFSTPSFGLTRMSLTYGIYVPIIGMCLPNLNTEPQ